MRAGGIVSTAASPVPLRDRRTVPPRTVMLVSALGVSMAFLDNTIVAIAFPDMLRSFGGATLGDLAWVFNVYNIVLAALLVPAGRLADLLGRRRLFAAGIVVFTVASALCALAPSAGFLIAARALQGAGAAIILPASLGLVLQAYPGSKRTQAIALWTVTGAIAAALGPSLGGVLVDLADWRLVFLVNLPVGVVAWRLASTRLVESRAPGRRGVPDLLGALVLAVAIGTLSLALIQSESWGWISGPTVVALLVFVIAAGVFLSRCRSHPAPIVDLDLFRNRAFAVSSVIMVVGSAGFFAVGLANVLYLIEVWGYSPLTAGLAATPSPFLAAIAAIAVGRLLGARDPRPWIVVGSAVWAVGPLVLIGRFSTEPDFLTRFLPGAAVLSIGIGVTLPLVASIAVSNAGEQYAGATALNSAIRQVGAAIGVAILVVLVGRPDPATVEAAFERAWWFGTICFAAVAVSAVFLGRAARAGDPAAAEEEPGDRLVAHVASAVVAPRPRPAASLPPRRAPVTASTAAELLRGVALFSALTTEQRDDLAARTTEVELEAGSWLFRQGDPADALYVVRSGRLEIVDETPGGPPRVLNEISGGVALGELALLRASPRTASARARRDLRVLRVGRDDFEAVLASSPSASRALLRTLSDWLVEGQGRRKLEQPSATIAVVALDARAQDARLDLELAERLGVRPVTQHAIAGAAAPGQGLSELLDRLEAEASHVVVSAGCLAEADAWTGACLRQADRVLVVVDGVPPAPEPRPDRPLPQGADVVLLSRAEAPGMRALLDALAPRRTFRVRAGDRRAGDVAAMARRLSGRSTGLVLSGGGARCFTQIGVIEELLAAGVQIDRVGGTSMGSLIGALFAQELDVGEIDARCYEEFVRRNPLGDYRFPRTSLVRGKRARAMLQRNLPGLIEDLPLGFFSVSVDLIAAETVLHRRGRLDESVGASMNLPIFAPPLALPGRLLLDGALMDNLPAETMAADGEGPVIAVDVSEPSRRRLPPDVVPEVPTLAETIFKMMMLSGSDSEHRGSFADVLIRPDFEGIGILEFHMIDRMREAGRRAARETLEHAPALSG